MRGVPAPNVAVKARGDRAAARDATAASPQSRGERREGVDSGPRSSSQRFVASGMTWGPSSHTSPKGYRSGECRAGPP